MRLARRVLGLVFLSAVLVFALACKKVEVDDTSLIDRDPAEIHSHYVGDRVPGNKGAIVFVHGVWGGDPATWTNAKTKAYWPELLTKDSRKTFAGFDVYAFDYSAPLLKNALTITELAQQMESIFVDDRVFDDHDEVVFICHSMGGLVVREYLQNYQKRADKVSFIYFYSTPTQGSQLGALADLFSQNPEYGQLVPLKRDSYLMGQLLRWTAARLKIPSYCAYETQKTKGIQVVTPASASVLCPDQVIGIEANHIDIVKPKSEDDISYKVFRNAFNETRAIITFPVEDLTLEQAIEAIVSSDDSGGGNYKIRLKKNCDPALLKAALRGDAIKATTEANLIAMLSASREDLSVPLKLSATKSGGYYEIECSQ